MDAITRHTQMRTSWGSRCKFNQFVHIPTSNQEHIQNRVYARIIEMFLQHSRNIHIFVYFASLIIIYSILIFCVLCLSSFCTVFSSYLPVLLIAHTHTHTTLYMLNLSNQTLPTHNNKRLQIQCIYLLFSVPLAKQSALCAAIKYNVIRIVAGKR